jgi:ATP-binding cassette, subfamily B, bacterial CvaB/MchF/RaxB
MLSFSGAGRLPLIRQSEAAECGLACLAMVASYYGHRIDLNTLRRRYPVSLNGVTLRALIQVAHHLRLVGRPLRFELKHLFQLHVPAILHWDLGHFVVLKSVKRSGVIVHDPAYGARAMSHAEASKHMTGVALELTPSEGFVRKDEQARLPLSVFWSHLLGSGHALLQIFALSVVLQLLLLAGPFYMQLTVDEVIARGDVDLLVVLALGFGLLILIRVASSTIRSLVLVVLQNALHFQLGARLFNHLIRLPMSYFEKRHIGDILSRFTSLQPMRNLLSEGLIASVLDGVMAILSLVIILIYSPLLAGVVIGAVVLYAVLRLTLYRVLWRRTEATIEAGAQESSTFIETVRAIQSLKLFNRESERESQWLNRFADVANANIRLGRAKAAFSTLNDLIFGLETILSVYIAANLTLSNQLTVGMIFAFMAYKMQFTERTVALIEKSLEFRMLGLHLERLSDIALTEQERGHDQVLSYARPIEGRIELRNVFFRYSEAEPFVLEDVNLTVEPGEFITIRGPSGGGKTTLMKLMLGLLQPTSGEVLIDGVPLQTIGTRIYREQVAAVMQEDQLLSGSIADNICFFDPKFEHSKMMICAGLAGIHYEIMAMPMTYNSLVGDMGSSLSSGQKQRVLLARALYRDPRILFLDEGTAHLDPENERLINESLRTLKITLVSVAHRSAITSGTDRIVCVSRRVQYIIDGHEMVDIDGHEMVGERRALSGNMVLPGS